jgi:hypothetical protein
MAKKAEKRVSTPRKTASKKPTSKKPQREGLDLIDAGPQRRTQRKLNLNLELRMLHEPEDVESVIAIYDAYMAAAYAIQGIINQPRAQGIDNVLEIEFGQLILKAWTVAEYLKGLKPLEGYDQEHFVKTLIECAIDMGHGIEGVNSVFRAAMAVGAAAPDHYVAAMQSKIQSRRR